MRKLMTLILSLCLIASMALMSFATEADLAHAPDLNDASRLADIERLKDAMATSGYLDDNSAPSANSRIAYPIIRQGSVSVPLYQQTTSNYCGPACVQMTLASFGVSATQSTLATQMGTGSPHGTYVYKIRDCLNSYLGSGKYKYVLTSEITFVQGVEYSIDEGCPVVCHVDTVYLPVYNGYSTGHYVVATGYFYQQNSASGLYDEKTIYYNDPNNNSSFYGAKTCTYAEMTNAINGNAGYYIMGG